MNSNMDDRQDLLDQLNNIKELSDTSDLLDDEEITKTLVKVVKIMNNPNVDPRAAAVMINGFTAQYFVYRVKFKYYMLHKDEPDAAAKKNMYATISEALYEVISSLKYVARMNER